MVFDSKHQFNIDSIEPFLTHLKENGYEAPTATLDDLHLLAGGNSRSTLKLDTSEGSFVCHVQHDPSMMKMQDELAFQEFMSENGVKLAPHVGGVGTFDAGHEFEMTQFIENHPPETLSTNHITNLGRELAKFHEVGKGYVREKDVAEKELSIVESAIETVENSVQRVSALSSKLKLLAENIADNPAMLKVYAEKTMSAISSRLGGQLEKGMIHGDVHKGNVLFDKEGEVAAFIDFENARQAPLVRDVSLAMRNVATNFDAEGEMSYQKFSADDAKTFIMAYNEERKLSAAELKYIEDYFQTDKRRSDAEEGFTPERSEQIGVEIAQINRDIALENLKHSNKNKGGRGGGRG